jgi:hypothetical protein
MSSFHVDCTNDDNGVRFSAMRAPDLLEISPAQKRGDTAYVASQAGEPINWSQLEGEAPIRTWWIRDFLTPAPTLLAGAGGSGKSLLMQTLCTSLATGRPYLAPIEKPLTCLIWSCEDDQDEVWRRQDRINDHFKITKCDLSRLHIVPRVGRDNTLMKLRFGQAVFTPLLDALREQVRRLQADVLVLDNIAHLYGGTFDSHQVTEFVNAVAGLVTDRPFAPIFVGHVARAQGSEFAGSAAWENAVRARWYLEQLLLKQQKANYAAKVFYKFEYSDGILVPENARSAAEQKRRIADAKKVLEAGLAALRASEVKVSPLPTSPNYLPKHIEKYNLAGGCSRDDLAAAMRELEIAGQLVKREQKTSNGKTSEILTGIRMAQSDLRLDSAA